MTELLKISSSINSTLAKDLARSYNILYSTKTLKSILKYAYPDSIVESFTKYEIHFIFNEIITRNYNAEALYKSLLVDEFINEDVIAAFEINANNSRLDFLKINGHTVSYEIKSEVDNLSKIEKQISDYSELFDYNYVVIGRNHLLSIKRLCPPHYGIIIVEDSIIKEVRKPKMNNNINSIKQLNVFTKKELNSFFGYSDIKLIDSFFSLKIIAENFRAMLKQRYEKRWLFLKEHKVKILPIDYQYFYNHNIPPSIIYNNGK